MEGEGAPIGRRVIVGMLAAGAAGVVFGGRIQSAINSVLAPLTQNDPTGLTSLIPTGGQFRYYSVTGSQPHRSDASYRLTVRGLVERPATYTLEALRALPQVQLTRDFQCVTGWRVEEVPWTGVRLSTLLDAVRVRPAARAVLLTSFDGTYTESLTLDQARRPDVIVALKMYGKQVTRAHGGPARLYVAPMYGYKSLKWLDGIELVPEVVPGYWERRGYEVDAWIGRSNGRGDDPA